MKVLLINKYHYLKGGAERAYFDMADILLGDGHEVAFFSMRHPQNKETKWSKYFVSNAQYLDRNLSLGKRLLLALNILFNFEAKRNLEHLIQEFRPDVAHIHNIYHQLSPSIFFALQKYRVPMVMTLHDYKLISPNYNLFLRGKIWEHTSGFRAIFDRSVKDSFGKSFLCALEKWLHMLLGSYRKIDVFVSPSRFLIEKFHSLGFQQPIEYLPNPLLQTVPERNRKPEQGTYLFFGRLSLEKGVETLLRALVLLPTDKKLLIAGDGPEREALEKLTKELGLSAQVTFYGAVYGEELEKLKEQAEAIILPSVWYENFPYTMTESLWSGSVVVASDQGGFRERIKNGENGFLFEPGNPEALAQTLRSLEGLDLDVIRKRARESVSDLTKENFLPKLLSIYARIKN